jgi:arginine utilization protein RocB
LAIFLSCDGKAKKKIWMTKPVGNMVTNYKQGKKKRRKRSEKEREEENCAENQQSAQIYIYCCHQHAKVAKTEHKERKKQKDKVNKEVDGPDHCIHVVKNLVSSSRLNHICVRLTNIL